MNLSFGCLIAVSALAVCGCSPEQRDDVRPTLEAIVSSKTQLRGDSCQKEIDKEDPNETPYLLCPGAAGYSLIVRRVEAGRRSIEVVDAAQQTFPLDYQEYVTRQMFELGDEAQWWVATRDGRQVPIALAVRVHAHEDVDDPVKVTRSYVAVAKIAPDRACVTEIVPESSDAEARVRTAAIAAPQKECVSPLPPMPVDGAVVR